jgi:hypothetical protein
MRDIPSRIRSEHVENLVNDFDLSDPFRILNPDSREFTYHPSGTVRKNRSRIDFFLISANLYEYIDSCTIAQGYCSKTFDHKPIFLNMKKRKGKGRSCIHDSTVNNPLSMDIMKCTVHNVTINAALPGAGLVGSAVLLAEKDRLLGISQIINQICFLQGEAGTRDLK